MIVLLQIRCNELPLGCSRANVRQPSFQNVKAFLKLRIADNQRNEDTHHVTVGAGGNGDQSLLVTILREPFCFISFRVAGYAVLDQVNCAQSTPSADFGDHLKMFLPYFVTLGKVLAVHGWTVELY